MIHSKEDALKDIRSVVMIPMRRVQDEEHPYCSRICCGHARKECPEVEGDPSSHRDYVLYRDVRTYGFYETYYQEARRKGLSSFVTIWTTDPMWR